MNEYASLLSEFHTSWKTKSRNSRFEQYRYFKFSACHKSSFCQGPRCELFSRKIYHIARVMLKKNVAMGNTFASEPYTNWMLTKNKAQLLLNAAHQGLGLFRSTEPEPVN